MATKAKINHQHSQLLKGIQVFLETHPNMTPLHLGVFGEIVDLVENHARHGSIVRIRLKNADGEDVMSSHQARIASSGGKARAASLTPEQRSAIARQANHARWHAKTRSRSVTFTCPCDLYDRLMALAAREGSTASESLRNAVDLYCDTWEINYAWDDANTMSG